MMKNKQLKVFSIANPYLHEGPGWGRWLSGRGSDSEPRGRGFETYCRRVVSLSKTLYSPKVLVIPRKR